jgi:hypothetical protein
MALSKMVEASKKKRELDVGHKEGHFFHLEAAEMSGLQHLNINTRD